MQFRARHRARHQRLGHALRTSGVLLQNRPSRSGLRTDPRPVWRRTRRRRGEESSIDPATAGGGPIWARAAHDSGGRPNTSRRVQNAHRAHARRSHRRLPTATWRCTARAAASARRAQNRSQTRVTARGPSRATAGGGSGPAQRRAGGSARLRCAAPRGGTNRRAPGRTAR